MRVLPMLYLLYYLDGHVHTSLCGGFGSILTPLDKVFNSKACLSRTTNNNARCGTSVQKVPWHCATVYPE